VAACFFALSATMIATTKATMPAIAAEEKIHLRIVLVSGTRDFFAFAAEGSPNSTDKGVQSPPVLGITFTSFGN